MADLSDELNATLTALAEATQILVELSGRNFSSELADLELHQALTEEATLLAVRLWNSIVAISNQVNSSLWHHDSFSRDCKSLKVVSVTLGDVGSLLQEALDIASEASRQSKEALDNVGVVDTIIQQIQVSAFAMGMAWGEGH